MVTLMSDQEKKHLYAVRAQGLGKFQPMVDQYEYVKETNSYHFVMERGIKTRLHKNNSKFRYFFDLDEAKIHLKKMKEAAIKHLEDSLEKIKENTTFRLNEVDPEPFEISENIRL